MTRERTTWNRDHIKAAAGTDASGKSAATNRTADPYAMNQDHLGQQPKADKYLTGDPSTFAEDITEPNTWDREYEGGATRRDEIGLPEMRPETFNHAEKTAGMDEKTLIKKADLCSVIARHMLKGRKFATEAAATEALEKQGVALMYMPNADLIETASRMSSEEDFPGGQFPHQQEQQAAAPVAAPEQQMNPMAQCVQALQQGDMAGVQSGIQQMVQQAMKQQQQVQASARKAAEEAQQAQQGQGQQQQAVQQDQQGQGQQQQQQQAQQEGQQQGPAQQQQQQQQQADDLLLDDMLGPAQGGGMNEMDIEMESPTMDTGEIVLSATDDEVLKTLFATQESQDAEQAQQQQGQQKQAGMSRTASANPSTRTIGTRPTSGVSKVGGAQSPNAPGDAVSNLSNLWASAPDVREAFGIR